MTEEDKTAEDKGSKDIKSFEKCERETLAVETRARRLAVSGESDKCK
jgi:hypothetical protein